MHNGDHTQISHKIHKPYIIRSFIPFRDILIPDHCYRKRIKHRENKTIMSIAMIKIDHIMEKKKSSEIIIVSF